MAGRKSNAVDNNIVICGRRSKGRWVNCWQIWAVLSAVLVSISAVLSKVGLNSIDSRVVLLIRTVIVLIISLVLLLGNRLKRKIKMEAPRGSTFLILLGSGALTGVGWLFYFRAMSLGEAGIVHAIDKLSVLVTAILSRIIWKQKMMPKEGIGLFVLSLGIVFLILL